MTAQQNNACALTPTQEAMLLYSLYAPKSAAYFEQFCYAFRGALDVNAFREAWRTVINRHPILRTSFHWSNEDGPRQVVHESVEAPVVFADWREFTAGQREQRLKAFLEADQEDGFDVSVAPLIRVAVLQTGAEDFFVVLSNHHLVLDGWSMGVVRREVTQIYAALSRGAEIKLAPAPQFSTYVDWLEDQQRSDVEDFWRLELAGFEHPDSLPIDLAPATLPGPDETFGELAIDVSRELSIRLQAAARRHRVTMSTIAQGAWALLLSRYCRKDDVLFGITVAGRPYDFAEVDSLVGVLINTLPLRVGLPAKLSVGTFLQGLQKRVSRLREHETTSLKQIHGWSGISNSRPLFETLVVFENFIGHDLQLNLGGEIELCRSHLARTNYPLVLVVNPHAELGLRVIYHRSRFTAESIARLLNHLVTIMESFATDLEGAVASVNVLPDRERHLLLHEWSTTAPATDDLKPMHLLIEAQAAANPEALAVVHDGDELTYSELNGRANKVARVLREKLGSAEATPLVGICLERSPELIVAVLAVLKAGAAYVPLDPAYPADRLALMLADSGARVLLTRQSRHETLPAFAGTVIDLDAKTHEIDEQSPDDLELAGSLEDLAYVMYTSGSTGTPKGVMIPHGALASFVQSVRAEYEITSGDRLLQFASLSFDTSVEEIFCALAFGATLVLRGEAMITSARHFLESCAELGVTVLDLPTGYWHHLVAAMTEDNLTAPETLRLVILGGEQAHANHVEHWFARAGRDVRLLNTYGPTEATVVSTIYDLTAHENGESIAIGRPIAGASVYVLDENLQPAPVGVPGELFIGGRGLALGYLNRPELTAQRFVANPFGAGRLYRSGDLVRYRPDGNLEFIGRADNQVKIRGFRIELEEIEEAIRSHDSVTDAAVKVIEDSDGDKHLCAYVVFAGQAGSDTGEVRTFLQSKLPPHMVPGTFVALDRLPLTANGKVDRRALPDPAREQARMDETFVAPRTPTEEIVAAAWCHALKLPRVGVNENFFELGGHSLLAARVFAELQKSVAIELSLVDIFNAPTVAGLANVIYEREAQLPASDELMSLLAELEELSDEEAYGRVADERLGAPAS